MMRPLSVSLVLSSALHGGLIGLIWLQMMADGSPSRTVLELIADEAAPVAAAATHPSRPAPTSLALAPSARHAPPEESPADRKSVV